MGDIGKIRAHWSGSAPVRGNFADRSPESVAEVLRHARLLQGYSLPEIAEALHIREGHLEAIEEGRFEDLPPLVYAQGFVAAYAGFLQIDKSEMVARFKDEAGSAAPVQATLPRLVLPTLSEDDTPERRMTPSGLMMAGAFVVLLVAYGSWHMMSPSPRAVALEVPPLPERFLEAPPALPTSALPATPPAPATDTSKVSSITGAAIRQEIYVVPTTPARTGSDHIITLRAKRESWVQLHNAAGQRVASFVLKAGEGYTLPAGASQYKLSTGNLATLAFSIDGQTLTLPGLSGREMVLNAETLLARAH